MRAMSRRRKRHNDAVELDVTAFMNLMIVLVPVLLLSMVFAHTTVIELDFPAGKTKADEIDPDKIHLEIRVRSDSIVVADGRRIIKRLPMLKSGEHDYENLYLTLKELKRRMPTKRDAMILLEKDTDYQTLVYVMDSVRAYRTVQNGMTVMAELFPVLSLGDVPKKGRKS